MKYTRKILIATAILFIGVGAMLAYHIMPKLLEQKEVSNDLETAEKTVVKGYACWVGYTFERAVDEAATIVYGKVKSKSDTLYDERDYPEVFRHYKEVTVEVLEAIKGVTAEETTITYIEHGGETEDAIYILEGVDPVAIGEEYIFFLNDEGLFLSPWTLFSVSDGVVQTGGLIPSEVSSEQQAYAEDAQSEEYNLEQYISAIMEELAE